MGVSAFIYPTPPVSHLGCFPSWLCQMEPINLHLSRTIYRTGSRAEGKRVTMANDVLGSSLQGLICPSLWKAGDFGLHSTEFWGKMFHIGAVKSRWGWCGLSSEAPGLPKGVVSIAQRDSRVDSDPQAMPSQGQSGLEQPLAWSCQPCLLGFCGRRCHIRVLARLCTS